MRAEVRKSKFSKGVRSIGDKVLRLGNCRGTRNRHRRIRRNNGRKGKVYHKTTIDKKIQEGRMDSWVQCHSMRSRRTQMKVK